MRGWGARIKATVKLISGFRYDDSQAQLGRHKSTVFEYEKEARAPDLEFLLRLQQLSGVSIDWIASGIGPQIGGVDRPKLRTAIMGAMQIVETARAQGKRPYTPDEIGAFVADIYESMIKNPIDDYNTSVQSPGVAANEEATDARHRKTNP